MTNTDRNTLDNLLDRWSAAEVQADAATIDALLTDDFVGIGPVGFALDKKMWAGRHEAGLEYESMSFDDVSVRRHGDAAILVAVQHADGRHAGGPVFPQLKTSVVAVREDTAWRIANVQFSFIAGTPGSPI